MVDRRFLLFKYAKQYSSKAFVFKIVATESEHVLGFLLSGKTYINWRGWKRIRRNYN